MCENGADGPKLIKAMKDGGLKQLREVTNNCPACILAGLIQYRKAFPPDPEDNSWESFDYKAEREKWMDDRRAEEIQNVGFHF